MSLCAVVVTFNRKAMLRDCLNSVQAQSRPVDHVLIVDNHSTDGTVAMLEEEFLSRGGMSLLALPENSGGAGGFAAGMDWAHKHGYEWIWVMDDDIEVLPDAIEAMLQHERQSQFIHCRKMNPNGKQVGCGAYWDLEACAPIERAEPRVDEPFTDAKWGNFEGALIHRSIVDKVGLPDARFFVSGDDGTYGLLASFHTRVIFLNRVGILRKLDLPARPSRMGWHLMMRNRFLFREYLTRLRLRPARPDPFWFHQFRLLAWAIKRIATDPEQNNKVESIVAVVQGLLDGARGRFGRPGFVRP